MRFVVYGPGAIGGVIGGLLHQAGRDVVLIARGEHLSAIQRRGLRVETPVGTTVAEVEAVGSPDEVGWRRDDVVLLTMKSDATPAAVRSLAASAPAETAVVCAQNGVANEPTALRWFEHVYGVCVMMPAAHLTPGVVESNSTPTPGILDIGRYPTGVDDRCRDVATALGEAAFVSEARADIMRWKHRKLLINLANAVAAVCARGPEFEELRALIVAEGEAALKAAAIEPVTEAEDNERRGDILRRGDIGRRPRGGGSTWQSLQRATGAIETDYLNGEVVLLGRQHGVPTPANELIRQQASRLAATRAGPASVDAADLLALLHPQQEGTLRRP